MLRLDFLATKKWAKVAVSILWTVLLIAATLIVFVGFSSYQKAKNHLVEQVATYAHLIAEHDRYSFTVADVNLQGLADNLTWNDYNGTMTKERRNIVLEDLFRHKARVPGIASLTVVGADGIRRIGVVGNDFTNLSDRSYFKACKAGQKTYISQVENGRASGKDGVHIARCLWSPDNKFGGLVVINMAAQDVFTPFYKSLNLGINYKASLRDKYKSFIQYPAVKPELMSDLKFDLYSESLKGNKRNGSVIGIDPLDGHLKIGAFERLDGTDLFATVTLQLGEALAEARLVLVFSIIAACALLFGALGITLVIYNAQNLHKARLKASKASEDRALILDKLTTAGEDERKSIANEIHDSLNALAISIRSYAQSITGFAETVTPINSRNEITQRAHLIINSANELYGQCRSIVGRLRPEMLDVLGLNGAIEDMVSNLNIAHPDCEFRFKAHGNFTAIDPAISIAAYRVVQESVSNIIKHAQAENVFISLRHDVEKNELAISIRDDGIGFDVLATTSGVGILSMQERVEALHGTFKITSNVTEGTSTHFSFFAAVKII